MTSPSFILFIILKDGNRILYDVNSLDEFLSANQMFLDIYGHDIARRFVVDKSTGEMFGKKQFIKFIGGVRK